MRSGARPVAQRALVLPTSPLVLAANPTWSVGETSARIAELRDALPPRAMRPSGGNVYRIDVDAFEGVDRQLLDGWVLRSGQLPDVEPKPARKSRKTTKG